MLKTLFTFMIEGFSSVDNIEMIIVATDLAGLLDRCLLWRVQQQSLRPSCDCCNPYATLPLLATTEATVVLLPLFEILIKWPVPRQNTIDHVDSGHNNYK